MMLIKLINEEGNALHAHSRTEPSRSWRVKTSKQSAHSHKKSKVSCVVKLHRLPAVNWLCEGKRACTLSVTHARSSLPNMSGKGGSCTHSPQRAPAGSAPNTQSAIDISMTVQLLCSAEPKAKIYRGLSVDLICLLNASISVRFTVICQQFSRLLCKKQTDTHWETLFLILNEVVFAVYLFGLVGILILPEASLSQNIWRPSVITQ